MKYTKVRLFLIAAGCCLSSLSSNTANAGWGLLHGGGSGGGGSSGGYGSYGAGYGSSGGAVAGYGSSGGAVASYGSSGGAAASYGSSGGYAATSYGSSGGSSGGGPGPLRRFAAHIHDHMAAKHARRAAYGSSGGSSGSYVSSGSSGSYATSYGSSGGYSSSYGSSGGAGYGSSGYSSSYGSSGGGVSYGSTGYSSSYGSTGSGYSSSYGSTGSLHSYGSAGSSYSSGYLGVSNQSPASAASLASQDSDAIYLNVAVPSTAKVYVNDTPTNSTGVSRQYVSRGLESGKNYKFELRAEVVGADGKLVKETKLVTLTAGQKETVKFTSLESTRVQTAVTLNVPADAKVILAGNETKASGETRTFRTSQLTAGERWDDYVVEVHHNGKVKRETLRLVAGDDVSLTFNFDDDKSLVASR